MHLRHLPFFSLWFYCIDGVSQTAAGLVGERCIFTALRALGIEGLDDVRREHMETNGKFRS